MKPFLLYILFFLSTATSLAAQANSDCYKNLRKEGLTLLQKKNYRSAVDKFFAARYCPDKPVKDDLDDLIKKTQDQWVAALDQAVTAATTAQKNTVVALAKADSSLALATKIIDAFYFYKDSFALAFKDGKYGFINKKGEVVIEYEYEEALPFYDIDYTRVKRLDVAYLLDTKGVEYRLATELSQLDSNIIALDLRDKRLDTFPQTIFDYPQLKILLLSENPFTHLPEGWGQLKNLEILHLSRSRLASLPESFGLLSNLRILNLFGNQLTSLPESIGQLDSLRVLDVSYSNVKLKSIPRTIGRLQNLQVLDLTAAGFSSLPETIGELKNLQVLNLRYTALDSLPTSLGKLSQLQSLDLHRCGLERLPSSIGQLRNLQSLNLSLNELAKLPESIGALSKLQTLELFENKLTTLPESIGQLSNLQNLILYKNELSSLPESIGQLKRLQKLNLYTNPLAGLPESIGQLSSLQSLVVSVGSPKTDNPYTYAEEEDFKPFTRLPASVIQLSRLENLSLHNTKVTSLPEKIGQLKNLQHLDLSGNQIKTLPASIGQLSKLEDLDLSGNLLTDLPSSIRQLTNLQKLNLSYNPIQKEALQRLQPKFYIEFLLRYAKDAAYAENYKAALNCYRILEAQKPNQALNRKEEALNCSTLTWELLLKKEFKLALEAALLAQRFDDTNANLYTNLPLAYLFNNQFEKAKAIYLAYKAKMYNGESYKAVFLKDFDELEADGITHPDIAKIRILLEK